MNKDEAKGNLQICLDQLKSLDLNCIDDDGQDDMNHQQNYNFSTQCKKLDNIISKVACVDIDGIDESTLNHIWKESWGYGNRHLPENKYNQIIRYINTVIELL